LKGKKIRVRKAVITPAKMDSGTPILTKSPTFHMDIMQHKSDNKLFDIIDPTIIN
jgi:hypothetical protein